MSDAGKDPTLVFQLAIEPRWRDLDAFGHVNNSSFLTYLEEARIRWFETFDGEWVNAAMAPLLAAVQLNYRAPIDYPSQIRVELLAERIGNTSLTVGHRVLSADGATLHADGHVVMVWIDRATGRPIALPELVLKALG
jgi:acyl-CoA thioester hydrolase